MMSYRRHNQKATLKRKYFSSLFIYSTLFFVEAANSVNAQSFANYPTERREKYCPLFGQIASLMLENRLLSLPLSDSISFAEAFSQEGDNLGYTELGQELSETFKQIAIAAYKVELSSSQGNLSRIKNEFRSEIEVRCFEGR